jgi:hypothetical protein
MKYLVAVLLLALSSVVSASPPECGSISIHSQRALHGSWQGIIIGRSFFEKPYHLEMDEQCIRDGGCLLVLGFHDSVSDVFVSEGPLRESLDDNLVLEFVSDGVHVELSARFVKCSPVSGEMKGVVRSLRPFGGAELDIVGMRFTENLFELLSRFDQQVHRVLGEHRRQHLSKGIQESGE